jgi:hypothetical protein
LHANSCSDLDAWSSQLLLAFLFISILSLVAFADSSDAQDIQFKFGAAGDFGSGRHFHATANAVKARNLDFMLALGDLSYSSNGEEKWCKYWSEYLSFRNLLIVPGNHDTDESSGGDISDYLNHCRNPFQSAITGRYPWRYYFDYPTNSPIARFIMVSPGIGGNNPTSGNYSAGTSNFNFVSTSIDDAREKKLKWIVVGMHKNYITTFVKRNEISTDEGRTFMAMLLDKKVDLILQAHEHGYERSKQLTTNPKTCPKLEVDTFNIECVVDSDDDLVKGAGTVIHVIGTGGKGMRKLEAADSEYEYFVNRFSHEDNETFGFGEFSISASELSFSFVRSDGGSFTDSFRIREMN